MTWYKDEIYLNTSDDQKEINVWLSDKSKDKEILWIGIGNSSLAIECQDSIIDGVTICQDEVELAKKLFSDTYRYKPVLIDKYSEDFKFDRKYDFIIDNNPISFITSKEQGLQFLRKLKTLLKPDGMIVTHVKGVIWNQTKVIREQVDKNCNFTLTYCFEMFEEAGLTIKQEGGVICLK